MMIYPWTSPPGDTWETTDIWVDSPVNGYGTYRYGTWASLSGDLASAATAMIQPSASTIASMPACVTWALARPQM